MYKELDITIGHPAINEKYAIEIHVDGYEARDDTTDWHLNSVQWKTYTSVFAGDIEHCVYDVWMTTDGKDLLDLIDKLKQLFTNKL